MVAVPQLTPASRLDGPVRFQQHGADLRAGLAVAARFVNGLTHHLDRLLHQLAMVKVALPSHTAAPSSNTSRCCSTGLQRFLGFRIGAKNCPARRDPMIRWVGCPWSSSSQWRAGYAYGELR